MQHRPRTIPAIALLAGLLSLSACQASGPEASDRPESQVKPKIQTVKPSLPDAAQALIGRVYHWTVTYPEHGPAVRPDNPGDYSLRFAAPDRITLKADCNQYAGPVRLTDTVFSAGTLIGTRALCPKGSLEGEYIRGIEEASGWHLENGTLILTLPHDEGSMHFEEVEQNQSE